MIRCVFILALIAGFSFIGSAQNIDADLEKAVHYYNDMRKYEDVLTPVSVKDSSINRLKSYISSSTPLLDNVLKNGNDMQKRTARYFTTCLQYELGFVYGMKGENHNAYDVLKKIDDELQFYSDSTQFPMSYQYGNTTYSIKYNNFAPTLAEYYTGMGEICTNIGKYNEAVSYLRRSMNFSYTTAWYKYIAASKLWDNKRYLQQRDNEYLQQSLIALQMCSRLDTSYQRIIRENRYNTLFRFADTLDKLLQQNPSWSPKGDMYVNAAVFLDSAKETNKAAAFYEKAIALGLNDKGLLRKIIEFAHRIQDVPLENKATASLQNAYANEPDEVIRNLGTTLDKIIASANDPSKHLYDLKGRSMKSRRYHGDMYHSSVELPGAVESFVTDFLKNSSHNYYYWESFIDEEEPAKLQGRLKQRYEAVCNEIKNLYPNAQVTYQYNDEHYFTLTWNQRITIQVNYYYNEGYKDVILLTVKAEYPK